MCCLRWRRLQVHEWLAGTLPAGARVGIDASVHTIEVAEKLQRRLRAAGQELVPLAANPVDGVWGALRPASPDVSLAPPSVCVGGGDPSHGIPPMAAPPVLRV